METQSGPYTTTGRVGIVPNDAIMQRFFRVLKGNLVGVARCCRAKRARKRREDSVVVSGVGAPTTNWSFGFRWHWIHNVFDRPLPSTVLGIFGAVSRNAPFWVFPSRSILLAWLALHSFEFVAAVSISGLGLLVRHEFSKQLDGCIIVALHAREA